MKIIIPMAGEGSRFSKAGYSFPKPLIEVEGLPMISQVINNLKCLGSEFIFLARQEHLEKYSLESTLRASTNNRYSIVPVNELTQGAACTLLLAKDLIDGNEPLLIANSDQIIEWSCQNFLLLKSLVDNNTDFIFTFNAVSPKWSFARTNDTGRIVEVAEKNPISDIATCGLYYWGQGSAFVSCAEEMISRDIRINGEFYAAPVYNVGIERGRTVYPFYVNRMWGIGTPEDLNFYLARNKN